ncbi:MAG TPA: hypothetical protein VIV12_21395 [Streptosporangiaceae bacterium]
MRRSCPGAGSRLRSSLRVCPRLAAAGAWGGSACGQRDQSGRRPGLGRCALAAGRTAEAELGLRQAREICQRIGAAEASGVAAELDALTEAGPNA